MKIRVDYVVAGLIALLIVGYIGREWIRRPGATSAAQVAPADTSGALAKFQEHTRTGLHYYYDTHELDKAEAEFRKSIDATPANPLGYNNLGSSLIEQKKLDEAIIVLEKAVALDPNLAIARNNLAWARVEKSKLSK